MPTVPKVLVVGGGYAGFYTAWQLEKLLRAGEAEVVVVDPRPYMTYQPFLPEVAAGSVEARHAAVSLRRHLHRTTVVPGSVTRIDHAHRQVGRPSSAAGGTTTLGYDVVVVTAGAVTRRLPVPGVAEHAIGLKHVEEAVAIRDRLLVSFDRASVLPAGPGAPAAADRGRGRRRLHRRGGVRRAALAGHRPARHLPGADDRTTWPSTWSRAASGSCPRSRRGPGAWVVALAGAARRRTCTSRRS